MRCERLTLAGDPAELAAELRALVPAPESVSDAVAEIIAGVQSGGDRALLEYTRRFDGDTDGLEVSEGEPERAAEALDSHVKQGLEAAIDNVRRVAQAGLDHEQLVEFGAHRVALRSS